jgi:hypothetical protein
MMGKEEREGRERREIREEKEERGEYERGEDDRRETGEWLAIQRAAKGTDTEERG